jgi:histidinol phosphatase-like PHP family hydrolase
MHTSEIEISGTRVCIARDYYSLWTDERMQKIVAALKRKDLAVEINDLAHAPHERFIHMAKEQRLKFTFGSDIRDRKAGRLDFCKYVAKKCNLKRDDFFFLIKSSEQGVGAWRGAAPAARGFNPEIAA